MAKATGVGLARRERMNAATAKRNRAHDGNLARVTDAWFALLFDVARGAHVGPLPKRSGDALKARGLVDAAGGVTRDGYRRLMARRLDPIADRTDDEVIAYYEALRDAPPMAARQK